VKTRNVVGRIEGSDPVLKNEVVILARIGITWVSASR
jgi:hypothetical protein